MGVLFQQLCSMKENMISTHQLYPKMAALCSRSEQCSSDIRKKILDAGNSSDEADEIIETLKRDRFLDDERYIRSFVSDKFRLNKWGKVKIRHYLKVKGLPDGMIQKGLDEINENKYRELLIKTMKEKAKTVKKKERFEKMGQIIRFAMNRGFEPEIIHRYLGDVVK
jgi:regulatory protein